MTLFRRKIYDEMLRWKEQWGTRCALLINGARRVGKSTVVTEFVRNEYSSHILIDFTNPRMGTIEVFERFYGDIPRLLAELAVVYGTELIPGRSAIIFDEVQHYPKARQLIKYLVQDGRYTYFETGSLISIYSGMSGISNPSEEIWMNMHPMDFDEFCWAMGYEGADTLIRDHFERQEPLGRGLHEVMMARYKTYMLVGGMPQAVAAFVETGSFDAVESEKSRILDLYRRDLNKIPGRTGVKAVAVFDSVPSMLSRHRKAFSPGMIVEGSAVEEFDEAVQWLVQAMMVDPCYDDEDPDVMERLNLDRSRFKCYLLDTGLLLTHSAGRALSDIGGVHADFVKGKLSVNEGMFFENAVAQALVCSGHDLRFHEFYKAGSKNLQEVDFIIFKEGKIVPMEVKSSISGKHASLDAFMEKYHRRIGGAYVIHSKDLRIDGGLVYLPVYMCHLLRTAEARWAIRGKDVKSLGIPREKT